jgi:hypothetical protein
MFRVELILGLCGAVVGLTEGSLWGKHEAHCWVDLAPAIPYDMHV